MVFRIGFKADNCENKCGEGSHILLDCVAVPRKSVVKIYFEGKNTTLSYYNDRFDLHNGDLVYVDGSMEGLLGRVMEVTYNFKIKVSEYKKVIAKADTTVKGRFYFAGSHFVTFDSNALPSGKAISWYKAPGKDDEEYEMSSDGESFPLNELKAMKVSGTIAKRGHDYFMENRVKYICVDKNKGYAVVEGSQNYEVEFEYKSGEIRDLVCTCLCSSSCKHEVAAMLQLRETLEYIEKNYADEYEKSGYFAAVLKCELFNYAILGKEKGAFEL